MRDDAEEQKEIERNKNKQLKMLTEEAQKEVAQYDRVLKIPITETSKKGIETA